MKIYNRTKTLMKVFTALFLLSSLLSSLQSQEKINSKDQLNINQDSKEKKETIKNRVNSSLETAFFTIGSIYFLSKYNPYLQAAENAKQMRNADIYILLLKNSTNNVSDFAAGAIIADSLISQDPSIGYFRYKARESLQYSSVFAFFALIGFFWEKEILVQPQSPPPSASNYKFQPFLKMYGKDFEIGFAHKF